MGHARALLSLESESDIVSAFKQIVKENLSVRAVEKKSTKKNKPSKAVLSRYELRMQNNLSYHFSSKVKINKNDKGGGQITIYFKNEDQLNDILDNFE